MTNNQTQINLIKSIFNKLINKEINISLAAKAFECSGDDLNQIYQDYLEFTNLSAQVFPDMGFNKAIHEIEKLLNPELYKIIKEEPLTLKDQCYTAFTDFYGIDDKDKTFDQDLQKTINEFNKLIDSSQKRYATDDGYSLANILNNCLDDQGYFVDHRPDDDGKFNFYRLQKSGIDVDLDPQDLFCSSFVDFVEKLQTILTEADAQKTKYYCIEVVKRNSEGEKFSEISGNKLFDTEQKAQDYILRHSIPEIERGDRKNDTRLDDGTDPAYISFDNDYSYNFYITTLTF